MTSGASCSAYLGSSVRRLTSFTRPVCQILPVWSSPATGPEKRESERVAGPRKLPRRFPFGSLRLSLVRAPWLPANRVRSIPIRPDRRG